MLAQCPFTKEISNPQRSTVSNYESYTVFQCHCLAQEAVLDYMLQKGAIQYLLLTSPVSVLQKPTSPLSFDNSVSLVTLCAKLCLESRLQHFLSLLLPPWKRHLTEPQPVYLLTERHYSDKHSHCLCNSHLTSHSFPFLLFPA